MERVCFLPKTLRPLCDDQTSDLALFPRAGFAAASHNANAYVFGGSHDGRHQQTSQLWSLQFAEKLVEQHAAAADGRSSDFAVALSYRGPLSEPLSRDEIFLAAARGGGPEHDYCKRSTVTYHGVGSLEEALLTATSVDGSEKGVKNTSAARERHLWPIPRVGGRILCHAEGLYLFGGVTELVDVDYGMYLCDLWHYDFQSQLWTLLWPPFQPSKATRGSGGTAEVESESQHSEQTNASRLLRLVGGDGKFCTICVTPRVGSENESPQGRAGHVMVWDERQQRIIVFGGIRKARLLSLNDNWDGSRYYNDVWAWDLAGRRWDCLFAGGGAKVEIAPAVSLATGHTYNNCLYICGGSGTGQMLGGLYRFDLQKRVWLSLPRIPALQRDRHSSALLGSRLYVLGGFQKNVNILISSSPLISVDLADPMSTFRVDDCLKEWGVFWQHCLLPVRPLGLDRPHLVTLGGIPDDKNAAAGPPPAGADGLGNNDGRLPVSRWRQRLFADSWMDATAAGAEVADERRFVCLSDPWGAAKSPCLSRQFDGLLDGLPSERPTLIGEINWAFSSSSSAADSTGSWGSLGSLRPRRYPPFLLPVVATAEQQRAFTSVFLRGITMVLVKSAELRAVIDACQRNGGKSRGRLTADPLLDHHVLGWL